MGSGLPFWLCQAVFVALVVKNVALALFKVFEKCIVEHSLLIYVLLSSYLSFDKVTLQRSGVDIEVVIVILFEVEIKSFFLCTCQLGKIRLVASIEALKPSFESNWVSDLQYFRQLTFFYTHVGRNCLQGQSRHRERGRGCRVE